jgi:hypothetical protein
MKDLQMVHVIGKLVYFMLNGVSTTKYPDPHNPIVDVHINGTTIPNTLINPGDSINIIT